MANETQRDSTAQPTTREHSAAPTQRDTLQAPPTQHHRTSVDGIRVVVPESLRERFGIQKQLPTQGAEADILVAEDRQHSRTVIIKLYRHGIQPKSEVLDKIAKMAAEHVVQLYEYGQTEDGVWFEVMEYAQYGSLRDIIKKPLPAEQAKPVLQELQAALSALHSHNIIHRDLKLENILVRERLPLDLMLTDFGIASVNVATQHMTSTSRTAKYAAPEAASGVLSAKADWWSLGMIMLEVLTGKTPFDGMSDAVITKHLINHPITPDGVTDARWQQLLLGLLNRNDAVRWNGEQVNRWLAGEDIAVTKDAETSPNAVNQGYRPYVFVGVSYATPKALASGLLLHWDEAVKHLGRDLILLWFKEEIKDQDTISFLMDLKDDRQLTADSKLLRLVQRLDPSLPPIWKGIDVSPQGILALANAAQNDAQQRQFLWEFRHGALEEYQQPELQAFSTQLIEQEQAFELAWNTLDQAWQSSKQLDKSILKPTKPSAESVLPQLILISQSTFDVEVVRQSLKDNQYEIAKDCPWFQCLGNIASAEAPTLFVMAVCLSDAVRWVAAFQKALEGEQMEKQKAMEIENQRVLEVEKNKIQQEFDVLLSNLQELLVYDEWNNRIMDKYFVCIFVMVGVGISSIMYKEGTALDAFMETYSDEYFIGAFLFLLTYSVYTLYYFLNFPRVDRHGFFFKKSMHKWGEIEDSTKVIGKAPMFWFLKYSNYYRDISNIMNELGKKSRALGK